ncbi:helix-turn-helix domain-containing protein [Enterobacter bugandensis]|uniref:helix-turn-helix domain-containing protein n=1 Tax=Enterobacter bugandensis TaxID=881260 RepID=UPI00283AB197|nr:helix-turn-helix domain-containing protein [Enterobacter bugandensis]WMU75058.1 helix-turn-helix domain-containing protein [Enterobacter bugandensis]
MKVSGIQRKENIINNIEYLIKSRGETKASFANRTGVTRATLYKILEGKVSNVQHSTITRIADFFGVSCEIIENSDLEHIESIEKTLSPQGDKNPAAIPVVPQSEFVAHMGNRIGLLVTQYPLTWYFGDVSNMVALRVEKNIENIFHPGDILIIKRKSVPKNKQFALFYSEVKGIFFKKDSNSVSHTPLAGELFLGAVVEERIM